MDRAWCIVPPQPRPKFGEFAARRAVAELLKVQHIVADQSASDEAVSSGVRSVLATLARLGIDRECGPVRRITNGRCERQIAGHA
jgi:hypothetical protein